MNLTLTITPIIAEVMVELHTLVALSASHTRFTATLTTHNIAGDGCVQGASQITVTHYKSRYRALINKVNRGHLVRLSHLVYIYIDQL